MRAAAAALRWVDSVVVARAEQLEKAAGELVRSQFVEVPLNAPKDSALWAWFRKNLLEAHRLKDSAFAYEVVDEGNRVVAVRLPSTVTPEHNREIQSAAKWLRQRVGSG